MEKDVVPVFLELMVWGRGSKSLVIWHDATGVKILGLGGIRIHHSQLKPGEGKRQKEQWLLGEPWEVSPCPFHSIQLSRFGSVCSAVTKSCVPRWELLGHMRKLGVAILG